MALITMLKHGMSGLSRKNLRLEANKQQQHATGLKRQKV